MSHVSIKELTAGAPYLVLSEDEARKLIRGGAADKILMGPWPGGLPNYVTDPALMAALREYREEQARYRDGHTAVCPKCDHEKYDEAAGHCEECGFEGFDGDQDGDGGGDGGD